jgi:hypothetical protein
VKETQNDKKGEPEPAHNILVILSGFDKSQIYSIRTKERTASILCS